MSARESWPEYRICRECADTGATVLGNDGWYRHEDCARERNRHPYRAGQDRLLGCRVVCYEAGEVRVVRGLVHNVTSDLAVRDLADRYGERGRDYERITPTWGFPCEEVDRDD
jgi:hypothetical protein